MATEGGRKCNPTMSLKGEQTKNIQWTAFTATTHGLVNVTLLSQKTLEPTKAPKVLIPILSSCRDISLAM